MATKSSRTESSLGKQQQDEVKKLVTANESQALLHACELLASYSATESDWVKLFPKSKIQALLGTWEPAIWVMLISRSKPYQSVFSIIKQEADKRLNSKSSDESVQYRIRRFAEALLSIASDDVIDFLSDIKPGVEVSVESIPPQLAVNLARYKGAITSNAEIVDEAIAESLTKHSGVLTLNFLHTLSDTPASLALLEKLKHDHRGRTLFFHYLAELPDAVAESMGKFEGQSLELTGLKSLSDAAAEGLGKFHGRWLNLNGLNCLSKATAESLSKFMGDGGIGLGGLTGLSDDAAECLSKFRGGSLLLDGVTGLSDSAVESLSNCQCSVSLNGLTSLSDAAAKSLSKHRGDALYLDGMSTLSDAAAESLSMHRGNGLTLRGLRRNGISTKAAESLSNYQGNFLHVGGLQNGTDSIATILKQFKGRLM